MKVSRGWGRASCRSLLFLDQPAQAELDGDLLGVGRVADEGQRKALVGTQAGVEGVAGGGEVGGADGEAVFQAVGDGGEGREVGADAAAGLDALEDADEAQEHRRGGLDLAFPLDRRGAVLVGVDRALGELVQDAVVGGEDVPGAVGSGHALAGGVGGHKATHAQMKSRTSSVLSSPDNGGFQHSAVKSLKASPAAARNSSAAASSPVACSEMNMLFMAGPPGMRRA